MQKLLGNLQHGLAFILSAPAGTGKTTLVERLMTEFPSVIASVSYTTRSPRDGEVEGKHYHFISREQFERMIAEDQFLEYVRLYDYYYGTSKKWVREQQMQGNHVILVIDTQGALKLKGIFSATLIFVQPPSLEELEQRLEKRKTDSPEMIKKRLTWAKEELKIAQQYDYRIINDDFDVAYEVLKSILVAEEHRIK